MARTLNADAYARALRSEDVILLVGPEQETISVKKAFLALHSSAFAEKLCIAVKNEMGSDDATSELVAMSIKLQPYPNRI